MEGCKGCLVLWLFPCKSLRKVRPFDTGPDPHQYRFLTSQKPGKGDALRKETGVFCLLFVAAWTKSMASGGTQPAGFAFIFEVKNQQKGQQTVNLLSSLSKRLAELFQRPVGGYRVASLLRLPV